MSSGSEQPYPQGAWPPADEYPDPTQGGYGPGGYPAAGGYPGQPGYMSQPGYPQQGFPEQGYPPQPPFGQAGSPYPQPDNFSSNERAGLPPEHRRDNAYGGQRYDAAPPAGNGGYGSQQGYGPQGGYGAPPTAPYPGAGQPTGYQQQQQRPGGFTGAQRPPQAQVPQTRQSAQSDATQFLGTMPPSGQQQGGFDPRATRYDNPMAPSGPGAWTGQPGQPSQQRMPVSAGKPAKNRKVLIVGAGALVVVAIGAVLVVPKLSGGGGGNSDPGCTAYAGATLTAYDKTIADLNAHASQTAVESDIAVTSTDLKSAVSQAKQPAVISALEALQAQLQALELNAEADAVPPATITALNAAATTADSAC